MTRSSRTWWGQRFIAALEQFTDPGRLGRGRSYARGGRIESLTIDSGRVTAKVRGSINPYYGVYKEPLYTTTLQLTPIPESRWPRLIKLCAARSGVIARLLLDELPEAMVTLFHQQKLNLLPASARDFRTDCSCPDYANPCKHIAGVCYRLAARLDQDPLLLLELRGLDRRQLRAALAETPLGRALAENLAVADSAPEPVDSYYTRPRRQPLEAVDYRTFWGEAGRLPPEPPPASAGLPAALIRRGGEYPPFWDSDRSFVDVMSEFYERVRKQSGS
jgi:uncharacterized Zn finger protein